MVNGERGATVFHVLAYDLAHLREIVDEGKSTHGQVEAAQTLLMLDERFFPRPRPHLLAPMLSPRTRGEVMRFCSGFQLPPEHQPLLLMRYQEWVYKFVPWRQVEVPSAIADDETHTELYIRGYFSKHVACGSWLTTTANKDARVIYWPDNFAELLRAKGRGET